MKNIASYSLALLKSKGLAQGALRYPHFLKTLRSLPQHQQEDLAKELFFLSFEDFHQKILGADTNKTSSPLILLKKKHQALTASCEVFSSWTPALLKAWTSWGLDPHLQGNLPHFLHRLFFRNKDQGIHCDFLRIPSPSCEGLPFQTTSISPEYLAFLRERERENKRHLYINLQSRIDSVWNSEKNRCRALEKLPQDFPHFFIFGMDKNSSFYFQEKTSSSLKNFKKEFWINLSDPSGPCFFPPPFDSLLEKNFPLLFAKVHKELFSEKEELTKEERLDFIEYFHLLLQREIILFIAPSSCNISCRDSIDRAACNNSLLYLLQAPPLPDKELARQLMIKLLLPAFLTRKRPIRPDRFCRFFSLAQRILELHEQKAS